MSGDIYIRYLSFAGEKDLARALEQKNPVKVDIGAVYNVNPTEGRKGMGAMRAEERELVFDIDMTDYDDVRTCCKGADVCRKCWRFLAIACKVLNQALTRHFGFKHLLWVFSGRRGIHCWVCDAGARNLTVDERSAIAEYLSLVDGGKFKAKKCVLDRPLAALHPLVIDSLAVIDKPERTGDLPAFEQIAVIDQKLFETPKQWKELIKLCSNNALNRQIEEMLSQRTFKGPLDKLRAVDAICQQFKKHRVKGQTISSGPRLGENFMEEVKLQLCYPRLDVNVSKGLNHLLKSPFVVHPKTGRVCVPFDVNHVDSFDPTATPSVGDVITELDRSDGASVGCMIASLEIMRKFVDGLKQKTEKDAACASRRDLEF